MNENGRDIIDAREREEALDPSRSFIVEAPAGSGKTGLLMQRFLALLSTVERPEELLALTFTKKAAGEMQKRITDALYAASRGMQSGENSFEKKTFKLARKALARDSLLGWRLLENPGRLKVRTIDSLCASLARRMPLLSRAATLNVAEDASPYYEEAARRTVAMVEDEGVCGESARAALRHLDNSVGALMRRVVAMLEKRDQWIRHVRGGEPADALRERLEGSFRRLVETVLEEARDAFPERFILRVVRAGRHAAGNLRAVGSDSPITLLLELAGLPEADASGLELWHGLSELLLTGDGSWRKPKGVNAKLGFPATDESRSSRIKKDFQELLEELTGFERLRSALCEIKAAPTPVFDASDWDALLAFIRLLPAAGRHLMDVMAEKGAVDFQFVAASALKALGTDDDPTDLMLALDLRIRHILVDEYQDTSRIQLQLLRALTRGWTDGDGKTLFIVGDPMQSIYMFREAEVGLFLDAKENGIGGVRLEPLRLRCNFRSSPEIISWVNGAFAGAFPKKEDAFTGSVVYTPSAAVNDASIGGVGITLFRGRDDESEGARVIGIIKEIMGKRPGESIAVLCRSRSNLARIVGALKDARIRFRAAELDPLSRRAAVQDLLALLKAVLHPFDRVAWLASLRAPWCGAALYDLHQLCKEDRDTPVGELATDIGRMAALTEDGGSRIPPVIRKIKKAALSLGRVELRPLIEGLWIGLGGPACVDAAGLSDASAFFDVLASMGADPTGVEEKVERLFAHHGGDPFTAVDLMTIHRAKGLEFDNVIIPGLGKPPRSEDKKLMLWMERKAAGADDLLLAPMEKKTGGTSPLYSFLSRINRKKSAFELTRLFYVAATRARNGLFLFGHTDAGEGRLRDGTLLSVIKDSLDGAEVVPAQPSLEAGKRKGVRIKRLSGSWAMPPPAHAIDYPVEKEAGRIEEPEFHWAGERMRHLGTVVHRYLCRIASEGLEMWDSSRVEREKERLAAMLRSLGLDSTEAEAFAEKAAGMLRAVLNDKLGRWILGARGAVEEAVTGVVNGEVARAVIDRTFVDESGAMWVIDYKTGIHEGGSLSEFLESEKERYRPQLERYAAILREAEGGNREIRLGLYFPALLKFVEVS